MRAREGSRLPATTLRFDPAAEWLEADGLGGFASGTVDGIRTRRYHALLLVATTPPTGRFVLVNGLDAALETDAGSFAITSQRYPDGIVSPDGAAHLVSFEPRPWPCWRWRLPDGTTIEHELFVPDGAAATVLSWRRSGGDGRARLLVRPFFSGRDYHSLHHENPGFCFDAQTHEGCLRWRPYACVPGVIAASNGRYKAAPDWYRRFFYAEEHARGLDCEEDLATPGSFQFDLAAEEAVLILAAEGHEPTVLAPGASASAALELLRNTERRRRRRFASPLHQSAASYLVRRGAGHTLIAGYPWFTDWGRDTFIALRGLCLATGALETAREILVEWSDAVSEGMLPNRFPDHGAAPEFNAVDASLWFVVAVHEYLALAEARSGSRAPRGQRKLLEATEAILEGYARGTRFGIGCDDDGLLRAGEAGVQLTWMDARIGDHVVTPRTGKPVEIQALWLNALHIGSALTPRLEERFQRGLKSFRERFWCEATGGLYDIVDVDHIAGTADATVRPNQIFAVGGLPIALLEGKRARAVVDQVERLLHVPLALRSLAPGSPGYAGHYAGSASHRDGAYHQGTAWPWLLGPFVEAWVRVRGATASAKQKARLRFLEPLQGHLCEAGLGHVSELLDGDAPHAPAGCPFQAWSLGEMLRLDLQVLADDAPGK
jgi:predicted glycogen debranching enzyme